MKKRKIYFIINPISGTQKKVNLSEKIEQYIDKEQFEYDVFYTEYQHHAREICENAVRNNVNIVVAVGGDGTINEVVNGIHGSEVLLGIIPYGSGNGLARHLKIPFNLRDSIELINKGNFQKIDTISINNKIFVNVAGIGFDAMVAKKFSKSNKRGFLSYFKIVTTEYNYYRPKKYRLIIDGQQIITKALMIVFANSDQFGYNTTIAPDAKIDDGLMDICIVKKVPALQVPFLVQLLFLKQFDKTKYIDIIRTNEVIVKRKRNKVVNIDGEPVKLTKELNLRVNHKSLNVIVS